MQINFAFRTYYNYSWSKVVLHYTAKFQHCMLYTEKIRLRSNGDHLKLVKDVLGSGNCVLQTLTIRFPHSAGVAVC